MLSFNKFISSNKKEFKKQIIEDKNFFNKFKDMTNKKGC